MPPPPNAAPRGRWAALVAALLLLGVAGLAWLVLERDPSDRRAGAAAAFVEADRTTRSTLWAVGDAADDGDATAAVARVIGRERPDRLLYLGDVYETGTAREFERHYDPRYGELAAITAPTPGNHEWANRATGYEPYWRDAKSVKSVPHFYAFEAAGWRVLSLNSEDPDDPRQLAWLARQLRGPGSCILAFMHTPRFSAGTRHGDNSAVEPLWRALRGRVPLVVAAHEHNMQRLRPIGGTTLLISGAGGHGRYAIDRRDRRPAFANDSDYGALRLRLAAGVAEATFVALDGRRLDRSLVRCGTRA